MPVRVEQHDDPRLGPAFQPEDQEQRLHSHREQEQRVMAVERPTCQARARDQDRRSPGQAQGTNTPSSLRVARRECEDRPSSRPRRRPSPEPLVRCSSAAVAGLSAFPVCRRRLSAAARRHQLTAPRPPSLAAGLFLRCLRPSVAPRLSRAPLLRLDCPLPGALRPPCLKPQVRSSSPPSSTFSPAHPKPAPRHDGLAGRSPGTDPGPSPPLHRKRRRRSALVTTKTEDSAIAAAPSIGDRRGPPSGTSAPIATGISAAL